MAISKDTSLNMLRWFKEALDENIDSKLETLSGGSGGGELNRINNISIDGRIQSIDASKTAQLDLSAYAKKTDVTTAVSTISGGTTIISGASYTLQPATKTKLGGVMVGDGLSITDDGTLNVTLETGQNNVIEKISIDGTNQTVASNKTVQLNLSAYAKKDDLAGAVSSIHALSAALDTVKTGDLNVIEKISIDGTPQTITGKTAVLDLTDYAKKTDLGSGLYMKGSVNYFADLPKNPNAGDLYNIVNACFDDKGNVIRAGDNVFYTADGKWDNMAGFVDTSIYVEKETGKQLSSNDFTNALKTKLEGLENYTLPTASETVKGGVMIGTGLKMSGDTLNVVDHFPFVGATATKDGKDGLVPAPAAGNNARFLRGDGYWAVTPIEDVNFVTASGASKAVIKDVFTYPPNIPGTLWMDIVEGKHCLKFRYGDYEYIFLPDSSDPEEINPASLASFIKGHIYYLNTVPSSENGGMWYTIKDGEPVLWIHREGTAYSYDFGYTHDLIAYRGTQENLYSYLPFKNGLRDLMNRIWIRSIIEPAIEETEFGVRALRNMDKSLANTVSTSSGVKYDLPSALTKFTVEFWLSWNEDTNPGYKAAVVGEGNTYHEILNLYFTGHSDDEPKFFQIRVKDTSLLAYSYNKTVTPGAIYYEGGYQYQKPSTTTVSKMDDLLIAEENILEQKSAKRLHIAITRASSSTFNLFVNGKKITNKTQGALQAVTIFPYCVGDESEFRGLYIDHFRIWNQVVWDKDFAPPQAEDYIIY